MAIIHLLVEGEIDEAVARRIVEKAGHSVGVCYGKQGYGYIRSKIDGFNRSAIGMPYLVLVDFADTGCSCPGDVVKQLTPNKSSNLILRAVVPEIESWLLADRNSIANFLGVIENRVPIYPENDPDPKLTLVNIARKSRLLRVRSSLVPNVGSTATVGQLYNSEMIHFVTNFWDINAARENSNSLDKCIERLTELHI